MSKSMFKHLVVAFAVVFAVAVFHGVAVSGEKGHDAKPHWSYEGDTGPEHWGHMKGSETCSAGKSQSPIDIKDAAKSELKDLAFDYSKAKGFELENNGHTIVVKGKGKNVLTVNGVSYELAQFHFHAPSEHTVGGVSFPAELHFVHKNEKGELAVVGVMLKEGQVNASYDAVFKDMPKKAKKEKKVKSEVNFADLMPADKAYYTYSGSLTTPPCSENVRWIVLETSVEISKEQIKYFTSVYSKNNRPVQPMNKRELKKSK